MHYLFIIFILSFSFLEGNAQTIVVNEDFEVTRVMDQYGASNRMTGFVSGWRIQLMATTDRIKMEKAKEEFLKNHPSISIDWLHSSPYYKLLVGAFSSKLEATRILYQLKKDYPSAFPAKSKKFVQGN